MFPYAPWYGRGRLNSDTSKDGTQPQASPEGNMIPGHLGAMQESQRHMREDRTLGGSQYRHEIYCLAARIGYAILTSGRGFV
jgi:hypothetical protein